jgi:hypothetical protein
MARRFSRVITTATSSTFYGGGFIANNGGSGHATLKIVPGRTSRELFGGTQNYGLERIWGSHIHIVLRTAARP